MKRMTNFQALLVALASFCVMAERAAATTISDIPGDSAPLTSYTLSNVEVVGILDYNTSFNNATIVLQDATGSIVDFRVPLATYTPVLGDIINLTANNSPYQDGPELLGSSMSGVSIVSQGNPVNIPVVTIPQFNAASSTSGSRDLAG